MLDTAGNVIRIEPEESNETTTTTMGEVKATPFTFRPTKQPVFNLHTWLLVPVLRQNEATKLRYTAFVHNGTHEFLMYATNTTVNNTLVRPHRMLCWHWIDVSGLGWELPIGKCIEEWYFLGLKVQDGLLVSRLFHGKFP